MTVARTVLKANAASANANNAWTPVYWDTVVENNMGPSTFKTSSPFYTHVPPGCTKVRITLKYSWSVSAAGTTTCYLYTTCDRNGVTCHLDIDVHYVGSTGITGFCTGWLDVAAGDTLSFNCRSESAGNGYVGSGYYTGDTFVQFEWGA